MHAQFGTLTLRNIAIQLRWSNDGQLGMPAIDTIILAASQICYKLSPLQQCRLKTKLIMFYKIVHHIVAVPCCFVLKYQSVKELLRVYVCHVDLYILLPTLKKMYFFFFFRYTAIHPLDDIQIQTW
jgi:hypothetical protein